MTRGRPRGGRSTIVGPWTSPLPQLARREWQLAPHFVGVSSSSCDSRDARTELFSERLWTYKALMLACRNNSLKQLTYKYVFISINANSCYRTLTSKQPPAQRFGSIHQPFCVSLLFETVINHMLCDGWLQQEDNWFQFIPHFSNNEFKSYPTLWLTWGVFFFLFNEKQNF